MLALKGYNKDQIAEATAALRYHKAAWQEGAVYPSCLVPNPDNYRDGILFPKAFGMAMTKENRDHPFMLSLF